MNVLELLRASVPLKIQRPHITVAQQKLQPPVSCVDEIQTNRLYQKIKREMSDLFCDE